MHIPMYSFYSASYGEGSATHNTACFVIEGIGHVQYIFECSGPHYPEQVDELKKLAHVFYTSTCSLSSFLCLILN